MIRIQYFGQSQWNSSKILFFLQLSVLFELNLSRKEFVMKLFSPALILCDFVFAASFSSCTDASNISPEVHQLQKAAEQGELPLY